MKQNITQIVLIIVSILIAFGIDRAYESYKLSERKQTFLIDQVAHIGDEKAALSHTLERANDLRDKTAKGLLSIENIDSVIHYTQWLGTISFFDSGISSLSGLNELYDINEIIDVNMKKDFKTLYQAYENIEFYENDYRLEIYNQYVPFWQKHYNSYNKVYPDKSKFVSDEYLNIVQNAVGILDRRIEAYSIAMQSQENFIGKLKSSIN